MLPENVQVLCRFCNLSKGNKLPSEWIGGRVAIALDCKSSPFGLTRRFESCPIHLADVV